MSEIAGKHILITGAASGIGRLVGLKMAALGGRVTGWDIHAQRLDQTVAELKQAGREPAHGFVCNVAKRDEVYRAVNATAVKTT